jgi:hypothetical protein
MSICGTRCGGKAARSRSVLDLRPAVAVHTFNGSEANLGIYRVWYGRVFALEDKS